MGKKKKPDLVGALPGALKDPPVLDGVVLAIVPVPGQVGAALRPVKPPRRRPLQGHGVGHAGCVVTTNGGSCSREKTDDCISCVQLVEIGSNPIAATIMRS